MSLWLLCDNIAFQFQIKNKKYQRFSPILYNKLHILWYINSITTKANKTLGFLRRNINISSTTVKEQAYKSLVRPSLEFASSVWEPYTKENIIQLEQVQHRAARYVTNCYHNISSVSNMIEHLNWRSLADRRSDARLVMLYKISHELVAIPKTDILWTLWRVTLLSHSNQLYHSLITSSSKLLYIVLS